MAHSTGEYRPRVLLVEDNEANILVAQTIIEQFGCCCDVAKTGKEAIEKICDLSFDAILMDVHMANFDGFETTRVIRWREAEQGHRRLPIIAVTASAFAQDKERCLAAGMCDYLAKPYRLDELYDVLSRHLSRERAAEVTDP